MYFSCPFFRQIVSNQQHLLRSLSEIGLKEKEAALYLASLQTGPSTVLELAKASGLKRTTIYSVIESLVAKGLMIEELRNFKKVYTIERPEKLESLLDQKRSILQKTLPEFSSLYNFQEGESSIKFYQGLENIKDVYESLLRDIRPNEEYMIFSAMKKWYDLAPAYFQDFTKRRAQLSRDLGFRIRLIAEDSEIAREHKKMEKVLNETIRILPSKTYLSTNMVVIPKKVTIHQLTSPINAMVIENRHIVKMHQEIFEIMWNSLG